MKDINPEESKRIKHPEPGPKKAKLEVTELNEESIEHLLKIIAKFPYSTEQFEPEDLEKRLSQFRGRIPFN